ncbi:MAG: hypothetical protein CBC24_09130 [Candidatus Pelagibacter sp. TMED64]|nr:MAG: hypothetical protein CBC24_09130 [Candidatus Pelagibacter sp. TMED64]|tara:strand:+ start:1931 stop:2113 length:183 start_codon:yes stop_codon:yes gene_type:complete
MRTNLQFSKFTWFALGCTATYLTSKRQVKASYLTVCEIGKDVKNYVGKAYSKSYKKVSKD